MTASPFANAGPAPCPCCKASTLSHDTAQPELCGACEDAGCHQPDPSAGARCAHGIFGPAIHTYSRAQAFADGELVDLSGLFIQDVREAGIKYPLACTRAVFAECIELTPAAKRACNDVKGRLWDVLSMSRFAMRRTTSNQAKVYVHLRVVRKRVRPTPTVLKLVVSGGDDGEPVLTLMFPEES